jgi:hypothetical protein
MRSNGESRWNSALSAGAMKDSYGTLGFYAGAARLYRLTDSRIRARMGIGAFVAYRAMDWDADREFIPLLMPILSFEDSRTGLGINITASPSVRYNHQRVASFVFFQGTYRF